MLNVWSASCGVLSSTTDVRLALLTLSLAETVFDCTNKQKNKQKHVLGSISKITQLADTDSSKSEELTAALVKWRITYQEEDEKEKRVLEAALRPRVSDSLLGEVCCVDNCDS